MFLNLPGTVWEMLIALAVVLLLPIAIIYVAYRYLR